MGVCKANGYGTGLEEFGKNLLACGVESLAVATIEDAQRLRDAGILADILMLSSTALPDEAERIVQLRLVGCIGSLNSISALDSAAARSNEQLRVHLKLDTGFGRYGFCEGEEEQAAHALRSAKNLAVEGVFSHLSRSFSTAPTTEEQLNRFLRMVSRFEAHGCKPSILHIANSCAALLHPKTHLDTVRIGSAFVGRLPVSAQIHLEPVGKLVCDVAELHTLPTGHNVGYGNVYTTKREITTAILTAGTADGLGRAKSRDAHRLIDRIRTVWQGVKGLFRDDTLYCTVGGARAATLGRIGATSTVIDVTDLGVALGDTAEFSVNPLFVDSAVPRIYINTATAQCV